MQYAQGRPVISAEAIHSGLTRVAALYSLKPRQFLHELHIKPFDGPTLTHLESVLEALANDAWAVFCPRCILHDIHCGVAPYA